MTKHLPSDIDNLTRRELVEIYHIHAEEFQALQKRCDKAESILRDYIWFLRDEVKGLDLEQTGVIDLNILKLEQQAKGVEDFMNKYELCTPHNWHFRAQDYAKKLRNQVEQLKGEG